MQHRGSTPLCQLEVWEMVYLLASICCSGEGIQRKQLNNHLGLSHTYGLLQQKCAKLSLWQFLSFAHTILKPDPIVLPVTILSAASLIFNIQMEPFEISLFSKYSVRLLISVYCNENDTIFFFLVRYNYKTFHAILEKFYMLAVPCELQEMHCCHSTPSHSSLSWMSGLAV